MKRLFVAIVAVWLCSGLSSLGAVRAAESRDSFDARKAQGYLNESLALYRDGRFAESIAASNNALAISPNYAEAYNNICAAKSAVGSWDEAIAACVKALELKPDLGIAQNNLAQARKMKTDQIADQYVNESLVLYNAGKYGEAIAVSTRALEIRPDDAIAQNNICAAYNSMKKWDEGIEACTKAIQIAPDLDLAKANLAIAMKGKSPR